MPPSSQRKHGSRSPVDGLSSRKPAALNLPLPTPEEIRDSRLRVNLSQAQACQIVGFREVMTWSNCERRRSDGTPIATMDPLRWFVFCLITGQHPAFVLAPRLGARLPEAVTAMRRRGPAPAETEPSFVIEQGQQRTQWAAVEGAVFATLPAARAALEAIENARHLGPLRVTRYLNDQAEQVLLGATGLTANPRRAGFSLRAPLGSKGGGRLMTPSCARYCWRR